MPTAPAPGFAALGLRQPEDLKRMGANSVPHSCSLIAPNQTSTRAFAVRGKDHPFEAIGITISVIVFLLSAAIQGLISVI